MKSVQVLKSYFMHEEDNEFIIVDLLTETGILSKMLKIEDVLEHMRTYPARQLPDQKILKKAEELVLQN